MNELSLHQRPDQTASRRRQPTPCPASPRVKTCGRMVRSPSRTVPQIMIAAATSRMAEMQRTKQWASRAASVCVFISVLTPAAHADQIVPTYLAPKVEAATATQLIPASSSIIPVFGTENFDGRATGSSSSFTTNFNSGGAASANLGTNITGTFSGRFSINSAD